MGMLLVESEKARHLRSKKLLKEIIFSILYENDYSEELKLKIIDAISQEK